MADNSPFSPGDQVFGYGRDSGGTDQDLSLVQQEQALRDWCREHGIVFTLMYKDEAKKGSSVVGRDGLQLMMHALRQGADVAGVIVWKYNRFARNIDNAQYYRAEMRTLGFIFHSISDQVPEGPLGRVVEALIDYKDEQYLADLSLDIKRGVNDLVRIHGCVPGHPPVGFVREPVQIGTHRDGRPHIAHRWRPDPDLASAVLRAFQMRAARSSLIEIQNETRLYHSINSWRTFFSNPLYKGSLIYGAQRIDDYCAPIVPPDLWARVQVIQNGYLHRQQNRSADASNPRRASSRFILSGLCYCARCGSPLFGNSKPQRNGRTVDTYSCGRRRRNRDCDAPQIPKAKLEEKVLESLHEKFLTPEMATAAYNELRDMQSGSDAEIEIQRRALTAELANVRRQLNNVADAVAQAGFSPTLNERLASLENQRLDLQSRLAELQAVQLRPAPTYSLEDLLSWIDRIKLVLPTASDAARRQIFRTFIARIDVDRDGNRIRGVIQYILPEGPPDPKAEASAVFSIRGTPGAPSS